MADPKRCKEMSLDMWKDDVVVINHEGIPCTVEAHQFRNKVSVHVSAKAYADSPSCVCSNADDDFICRCNWHHVAEIKGQPRESFESVIDRAAVVLNSIKRCQQCGIVGEFDTCASCRLQHKINELQPPQVMSSCCPICLEDMIITDTCPLPCGHMLHIHCARRFTADCTTLENECPMCRAVFSFRHVSDYVS